jgi:hypothetical protein
MGILDLFRRSKKNELPISRREKLLLHGRITDGIILDSEINEDGEEVVSYHYMIHGVAFESSEILTDEQKQSPVKYAPGANVGIRFDPKNHHNSILV